MLDQLFDKNRRKKLNELMVQNKAEALKESLLLELEYKDFYKTIIRNRPLGSQAPEQQYKDYLASIKRTEYVGRENDIFKFNTVGSHGLNEWSTYIKFDEFFDQVYDTSTNANDASRLLLYGGNIKLGCTCPAALLWGNDYVLTQLDSALFPTDIFPKIRNPELKGYGLCKHEKAVILVLGFNLSYVAQGIKTERKAMVA